METKFDTCTCFICFYTAIRVYDLVRISFVSTYLVVILYKILFTKE